MASTSSGPSRSTKPYITSRQVQKLSPPGPARSVSPAIARWKAWLCRFGIPGSAMPPMRSPASPAPTPAIRPSSPISTRPGASQPSGVSTQSNA